MDSSYVFYMLSAPFGYCWSPILDASVHRKGVSDVIWPIGCLNDTIVVAILKVGVGILLNRDETCITLVMVDLVISRMARSILVRRVFLLEQV